MKEVMNNLFLFAPKDTGVRSEFKLSFRLKILKLQDSTTKLKLKLLFSSVHKATRRCPFGYRLRVFFSKRSTKKRKN